MNFTIFGAVIAGIGLLLLSRGTVMTMLVLMMACSLFGGSAAIILTAIGGSSVPPEQFAMVFALARLFLPGSGQTKALLKAARENAALGLYALYGLVSAIFAPRYFRDQMRVAPMRSASNSRWIFDTVPLAPSSTNITVTVYMIGSFFAGLIAYVAMKDPKSAKRFVNVGVVIAWIHITLGILAAVLKGTPFDLVIDFIRNANYAQTNQSVDGIVRITGVFSEPSSYVAFGFGWFVFLFECWLRDILPRRTGIAGAAMGAVLFCSTSSTAYLALAAYAAIVVLRILVLPQYLGLRKGLTIAAAILFLLIAVSVIGLAFPAFSDAMVTLLRHMTIDKQQSESGLQRAFWAKIGLTAFAVSDGLGVGPGSFRSSSFATAMLGSVGAVGAALLLSHLVRALKPLRISTYCGYQDRQRFGDEAMISAAAAWAAIGVLIPASIISPTCDVGSDFAVFTGVALALRPFRKPAPDTAAHGDRSAIARDVTQPFDLWPDHETADRYDR